MEDVVLVVLDEIYLLHFFFRETVVLMIYYTFI